jgi:DNA polymerase-1
VTKTLLVDGNNLFQIGFHGVREYYHEGKHIGAIYHFVNTIRRFIEEHNFNKVIVFWDGVDNSSQRRLFYPEYKSNRKETLNPQKKESYEWQNLRIRKYLEEMFIRQVEIDGAESDDAIAYYCQIAEDEKITIFSSDKDLTQLISENVQIYSPSKKKYYKYGDKIDLYHISIPHQNIAVFKTISGDKSDNIDGIQYLGEKTFVKLFPELVDDVIKIEDILEKAERLLSEDKGNRALMNLLSGKTRKGVFGDEFFEVNKRLVDLSNPLLDDESKQTIKSYYEEDIDPENRGYKNLMRLMREDGIFKYLGKYDNAWVNFLTPFMKLTRSEKRRFKTKKRKL